MDEQSRLRRARTFHEIAELNDEGRRECPQHFIDDLFALAEIEPAGARLLEIGCGTGQATLPLVLQSRPDDPPRRSPETLAAQ